MSANSTASPYTDRPPASCIPAPSPAARSRLPPQHSKIKLRFARARKNYHTRQEIPTAFIAGSASPTNLDRPSGADIFFTHRWTVRFDRRRKNGGKMKSKVLIALGIVSLFVISLSAFAHHG